MNLKIFKENRFFKSLPKNKFLIAFIINIVLFSLVFGVFTPMFETSDDLTMMQIASGLRYGEPSEYLVFINVILGLILKFFYQQFVTVNWYVIFLYLIHFCSTTIILTVFLKQNQSLYILGLYLSLFVPFEVFFLVNLQWTTTAMIAGCSGIISLIDVGRKQSKQQWTVYLSGIILLIISGWIRFNVYKLLILIFIPFIMLKIIQTREIKFVIPIIISGLILIGTSEFHNFYYDRDPAWKHYNEYNKLRIQLTDYPYMEYSPRTKSVLDEIGWSENDFNILKNWIPFDQDIYTIDALRHITSRIGPGDQHFSDILQTAKGVLEEVAPMRLGFSFLTVIVALLLVGKKNRLTVITVLIIAASTIVYLIYLGRLPMRVLHSILFSWNLINLYLLSLEEGLFDRKISSLRSRKIFLISTSLIILILLSYAIFVDYRYNENRIKEEEKAGTNDAIDELSQYEFVYALAPGLFKNQNLQISLDNTLNLEFEDIYLGGWFVPSPIHNNELSKYGIEPNFPALIRNDILIVGRNHHLRKLMISLRENYQIYVNFVPIFEVQDYVAFSLVKTAGPLAPAGQVTDEHLIFQWTPLENVTAYQIQVRREWDLIENFYVKLPEEFCSNDLCRKQFTRTLPTGDLRWRVRAKINDAWQPWSDFVDFSNVNE